MAACLPIVVSARGEAADLVECSSAGLAVPPEDPRALADALDSMRLDVGRTHQFGRAARRCAEDYDERVAVDRWFELITRAARRRA